MFEEFLRSFETVDDIVLHEAGETRLTETSYRSLTPKAAVKTCFVDGGNAPLFDAPALRLELIRVAAVIPGSAPQVQEQLIIIRKGQTILATCADQEWEFDIDDSSLRVGNDQVRLATVANTVRFILECQHGQTVAQQEGCKLIIRDGSLQALNSHEEQALSKITIPLAGVAKTSQTVTKGGGSAHIAITKQAPKGLWFCSLNDTSGFSKLHARAKHIFRIDARENPYEIACQLVAASSDPVFPGYPYPLIEADRLARVSHQEQELLRTRLKMEAGPRWKELETIEGAMNAHTILDSIGENRKHLK